MGVGKSSLESDMMGEIQCFLQKVSDHQEQVFDISDLLAMSITNNIFVMELGKRLDYEDKTFLKIKRTLDETVDLMNQAINSPVVAVANTLGIVRLLPKVNRIIALFDEVESFLNEEVKGHSKDHIPGSKSDFIDAYLTERIERQKQENGHAEMFGDDRLLADLVIIIVAAITTTTDTIYAAVLFMLLYPDVQQKIQREIDDVVGRERAPSYEDRARMPYTEAAILEIQRRASVLAVGAPRRVTEEDVEVCGYHVPKNSIVIYNIWGTHHDERFFPDPLSFRPERYINEEGKLIKPESIIPFAIGRRSCLGETLARMEIFLYLTSMLQKFTFKPPDGEVVNGKIPIAVFGHPEHFVLRAIERK
jgi:cytochrome P450